MSIIADCSESAYRPIPPSLVHKHSPNNVWVHHPRQRAENDLHLEYSYPMDLAGARLVDLMEVQRQAGIYFAHSHLGVPEDNVFVLSSISLERSLWRFEQHLDGQAPGGAMVVRECVDEAWAPSQRALIKLSFNLLASTGAATGSAAVRTISRRAYERVRRLPSPPAGPSADSVYTDHVHVGAIVVDMLDPLLSDHASDHVSAMAVLLSIERSVLSLGALRVDALSADFRAYVEAGEDAIYRLSFGADGTFAGVVEQSAVVCTTFTGRAAAHPKWGTT
ncbi:MAG: AfsA-related hotdog domain-containing protein [Microbacterium sp.]